MQNILKMTIAILVVSFPGIAYGFERPIVFEYTPNVIEGMTPQFNEVNLTTDTASNIIINTVYGYFDPDESRERQAHGVLAEIISSKPGLCETTSKKLLDLRKSSMSFISEGELGTFYSTKKANATERSKTLLSNMPDVCDPVRSALESIADDSYLVDRFLFEEARDRELNICTRQNVQKHGIMIPGCTRQDPAFTDSVQTRTVEWWASTASIPALWELCGVRSFTARSAATRYLAQAGQEGAGKCIGMSAEMFSSTSFEY